MRLEEPSWAEMEDWWREELASDPAYETDVTPMALALLEVSGRLLDVGCGEGRLMRTLAAHGADVVGVDLLVGLLETARDHGDVVRGGLPSLGMFGDDVFDGAVMCLVLEHIADHRTLFAELGRVVRPGGQLALIVNHPTFTAPESAPIQDRDEVLWRTGRYLTTGHTDEPVGGVQVRFHHRPMGVLLTDASSAGWDLERVVERGVSETQVTANPMLALQRDIPRLLGCRWVRR